MSGLKHEEDYGTFDLRRPLRSFWSFTSFASFPRVANCTPLGNFATAGVIAMTIIGLCKIAHRANGVPRNKILRTPSGAKPRKKSSWPPAGRQ